MLLSITPKLRNKIIGVGGDIKINIFKLNYNRITEYKIEDDISTISGWNRFTFLMAELVDKDTVILIDKHPAYFTSNYIRDNFKNFNIIEIPHHFAHAALPLVETKKEKIICAVFDGTGYGIDNTIWGGEFIQCAKEGFKRSGCIERFQLVGGDLAVKSPYRCALSLIHRLDKELIDFTINHLIKGVDKSKIDAILNIIHKSKSKIFTSSMGRLFDAVAVLCGFDKEFTEKEAEPAIYLTNIASCFQIDPKTDGVKSYELGIESIDGLYVLMLNRIIEGIIKDLRDKLAVEYVAFRFHKTIIEATQKIFELLTEKEKCNYCALAGGVFQNKLLKEGLNDLAFISEKISCTDISLGLGQIFYYLIKEGYNVSISDWQS
ncbi:MAG: hypothetical protein AB1765_02865 [Candidatus Hydrogenedentota bacterium]